MLDRISFAALAFAAALGATVSAAQAWDDTKYPEVPTQRRANFLVICCGPELPRHRATYGFSGPGMTGL